MIKEIYIQNYKSIRDLKLELGRLNVFIGENGCGKSNILEAIAMGSAAAIEKLDNEFLASRGIRVTAPNSMRSGFYKEDKQDIHFAFTHISGQVYPIVISNDETPFSQWKNKYATIEEIEENYSHVAEINIKAQQVLDQSYDNINSQKTETERERLLSEARSLIGLMNKLNEKNRKLLHISESFKTALSSFDGFLLYAPENYFLRRFEDETQIEPLGIRGEGLFKLLTVLSTIKPNHLAKIKESLGLIDWFGDFEIPENLQFTERSIKIKDRFLEEGLKFLDQRSANEGFLFLLFYFALFISDYTPKFFAIDNVDGALNPKLCRKLIERLAQLSKEHDKQAILTTHNPAVLDGLNLDDDGQRLFVIYRNADGHTKARRILKKDSPNGVESARLSEAFMRGYIGGLPENF